jgi:hypothetical protein
MGSAAFMFFQIFFGVFAFSSQNAEGTRTLELTCPACSREFAVETPSLDELAETMDKAPVLLFPQPVYQCPWCRFVCPEEAFREITDDEYAGAFIDAAASYAGSDAYRSIAESAPSCFLFARIVENASATPEVGRMLKQDVAPDAGPFVAALFYAAGSHQAEGSSWYGTTYDVNPEYVALGLEESIRCLEKVTGSREHPETVLTAAYMRADAHRRLGDFSRAKAQLALFQKGYANAVHGKTVWSATPGVIARLDALSERLEELITQKDGATPIRPYEHIEDYAFLFFQ